MRSCAKYARSERAVPTALAAPLLDNLRIEIVQLEKVLEADTARPQGNGLVRWWLATAISKEYKRLREELEDCARLRGRAESVRFTSAEFAARGQAGVRPASDEERALRRTLWRTKTNKTIAAAAAAAGKPATESQGQASS